MQQTMSIRFTENHYWSEATVKHVFRGIGTSGAKLFLKGGRHTETGGRVSEGCRYWNVQFQSPWVPRINELENGRSRSTAGHVLNEKAASRVNRGSERNSVLTHAKWTRQSTSSAENLRGRSKEGNRFSAFRTSSFSTRMALGESIFEGSQTQGYSRYGWYWRENS